MCNTPFCNCNGCVASCKKSRTTLYFSQRCETSWLRVTYPLQLATQFCQNGPIRAHRSQDVGDLARPPSCLLLYALQVAKKVANVWHSLCSLKGFLFVIVALQVARKIASYNMAFSGGEALRRRLVRLRRWTLVRRQEKPAARRVGAHSHVQRRSQFQASRLFLTRGQFPSTQCYGYVIQMSHL